MKEASQQVAYHLQPAVEVLSGKLYVGDTSIRDEPIYVNIQPVPIAPAIVPIGQSNWSPSRAVGQAMRDLMFVDCISSNNDALMTLVASMETVILDSKPSLAASGVKEFMLMPGDGYIGEIAPNRWLFQLSCSWLREF